MVYVLITALLLFFLVKNHLKQLRETRNALLNKNQNLIEYQNKLKEKNDEYYSLFEEYKAQNEDLELTKSKALKNAEHFKLLIDNAPDSIFIQTDNKIVYVNKKTLELLEANQPADLIGNSIFSIVHPDDINRIEQRVELLRSKEEALPPMEVRLLKLNNEVIDVETSSVPIVYDKKNSAVVFVRDITERKQQLKEIKRQKEFIQTILDRLPIGLAINRFNEGDATYMNKKFTEIYGWPEKDLINIEHFFKKVYPDAEYREKIKEMIIADIATGKPEKMHWENITITQKSGEKRIVNAVNIPIFEQNTIVSTVIDVTDLKKTEQELLRSKELAEESNRLKTAFINNISHEFRTPMNGILGFVDLLLRPNISETRRKKYADLIKESSRHLLDLVNDTVEVSHIQSDTLTISSTEFDLNEIIQEILRIYKSTVFKKGIKLDVKVNCTGDQRKIESDRYKVFRSIKHLVDNAIKFTKAGKVEIVCERNKQMVHVTVKDTGVGISPDAKDIIFDSFRQTEVGYTRNFGGNGIGLFIVKSYIDALGGEINFTSQQGEGSTFELRIPVQ